MSENDTYVHWFEDLDSGDTGRVGGKNSWLGEMIGPPAAAEAESEAGRR
jgi:phosphoenolpyruvate synthase/pyruvate phosphate dikinase